MKKMILKVEDLEERIAPGLVLIDGVAEAGTDGNHGPAHSVGNSQMTEATVSGNFLEINAIHPGTD